MAQQVIQRNQEKLSCSICLDLLKDPVTIPCGHNYCMSCIKDCWDEEREKETHSCPQCRKTFTQRPVLVKNTMLAELVEEVKKVEPQAASPDPPDAGPEDVACDFICSRHDEVMKIYCRTDHKCICYLCSMEEDHRGHHTVSAAAERAERQTELGMSRQKIQQRVQDRERDVKLLQQRVEAFNLSADEAVRDSEKSLTQLIRLIEKRRSEVTQQIRSQQKTQVSEATELEEKLQQEITDLRRKDTELEKLSRSEDHLHFLNNYPSLSRLRDPEDCPSIDVCPLSSFKAVTAAVSELKEKLQAALTEDSLKIWSAGTEVEVLPPAEPKTRAQFLRYSRQITLDPNTVHRRLLLEDGNRKVTCMTQDEVYSDHPDRFDECLQVLSKEGLTGRCYWEVKRRGWVNIAVTYKDICRKGRSNDCRFGYNNKSWSLFCHGGEFTFIHNQTMTSFSDPQSSIIGVYLDHEAGTLSYYRVSDTMTLIHRVQTRFTQPLYPGVWVYQDSVEFVDLR